MSDVRSALEIQSNTPVPKLLVELSPRFRGFFGNAREVFVPRKATASVSVGEFWPDVFVKRGLPWRQFLLSGVYHVLAVAAMVGLTHLFSLQPRAAPVATFDHSEVIYYQTAEYLPQLDTREESKVRPAKPDPEFSRQPIISVPAEADNHSQTIVTPPKVKLTRDVAMPNIVAWADAAEKPRLAMPPLTPAAEIARLTPKLNDVAVPPGDVRLAHARDLPSLQNPVAAPPSDLSTSTSAASFAGLQPALIAPPSDVKSTSRSLGDLNVAPAAVVAPAPQLAVAAQRTVPGGRGGGLGAPQVVAPPPSLSGAQSAGTSFGSRGRVIALNMHPAVSAPAESPGGNRRGTFAATPEGHSGASGMPSSNSGGAGSGSGATSRKDAGELPKGLYVGKSAAQPSAVAGEPASKAASSPASPPVVASVRPPRASASRSTAPESAANLTAAERAVFGGRRFYSALVNRPNLNSAGGSWVIRFAELNHESGEHDTNAPTPEISQPTATRTVDPAYPMELMRQNVAGTVILYAVIHADGSVGNVRVLSSVDERLERFASEAVAQWKFEPATKNGSPIDVEATFKIPFRPALRTSF